MAATPTSAKYPNLEFGDVLRLPALVVPVTSAVLYIPVKRMRSRHGARNADLNVALQLSVTSFHLALYLWHVWSLLGDISTARVQSICLFEFVTLIFGETALGCPNLPLSVITAAGWMYTLEGFPDYLAPQNAWMSLTMRVSIPFVLAVPCAWQVAGKASMGAMLSGTSLLTGTVVSQFNKFAGSRSEETGNGAVAVLVIFAACSPILGQLVNTRQWRSKLRQVMQRLGVDGLLQVRCMNCILIPIHFMALIAAGWILASFLLSCFPWRRLFLGQSSRPPSWDKFSISGGIFYSAVLLLQQFMQQRELFVDPTSFARRKCEDCLIALHWTNIFYILLWLVCEAVSK